MDGQLVYVLAPNEELQQMVRRRVAATPDQQLARTHQTMRLEKQALSGSDLDAEDKAIGWLLKKDFCRGIVGKASRVGD